MSQSHELTNGTTGRVSVSNLPARLERLERQRNSGFDPLDFTRRGHCCPIFARPGRCGPWRSPGRGSSRTRRGRSERIFHPAPATSATHIRVRHKLHCNS